jgi:lipopolysaccharide cholinephosphotransferase
MKQLDIKAVQQRLLNMAIIVDELCTKHSIPLYMISGTMLGAIRHT